MQGEMQTIKNLNVVAVPHPPGFVGLVAPPLGYP